MEIQGEVAGTSHPRPPPAPLDTRSGGPVTDAADTGILVMPLAREVAALSVRAPRGVTPRSLASPLPSSVSLDRVPPPLHTLATGRPEIVRAESPAI